jgi:eukaryotic-like serine/threonine-protein kinase
MQLMSDLVGRTLSGRYRLTTRVSGGHLGDVYGAQDELLDRPVAIKVLPNSLAVEVSVVERFREEARAVARLTHANAVAVYDWGADAGTFYMVMEQIPTTDLRDLLVAKGSLAPAQAAGLMAQVCDALSAAHQRGLVHRTLKPENILIAGDGTVKVADFGIGAVAPPEDMSTSSGMTTAVRYMSPEQALGFEASATSDVWAAGAILAEMVTGRPPLQGAGADLLEKRAHEEPVAPSSSDPKVPREIDEIVLKACALDPALRFFDASEMAHALRRAGIRSLPEAAPLEDLVEDISTDYELPSGQTSPFVMETTKGRHAEPRLKLRIGRIFAAIVVIVLLVAGGIRGADYLLGPGEVAVPNLVGLSAAEARDRVEANDLLIHIQGRHADLKVPEGEIMAQAPAKGQMTEGDTLRVFVSSGPPLMTLPSIKDLHVKDARQQLKGSGFTAGRILRRHSLKEDKGTVLRQLPAKGELEWGSKVHLVVSKGPPPVRVPRVAGTATVVALKQLEKAGLKPEQVDVYSDTVSPGVVISTEPAAGKTLLSGDSIKVFSSLGPEFEEVTVPNVVGMRPDAAVAQLGGAGLQAYVVESCEKGKRVESTDPPAGTTVRENDTVTVYVC